VRCVFEVEGIFRSSRYGIWLWCQIHQCILADICVLFAVGKLGMFEWCAVCGSGDIWRTHLGYQWFPMSGLGTCSVRAFGVFDCAGPCLIGRAVAGWVFVLIEAVLVRCPIFVAAVAVVAGDPACVVSLVLVVARGSQCAWLRRQWPVLVCVRKQRVAGRRAWIALSFLGLFVALLTSALVPVVELLFGWWILRLRLW